MSFSIIPYILNLIVWFSNVLCTSLQHNYNYYYNYSEPEESTGEIPEEGENNGHPTSNVNFSKK